MPEAAGFDSRLILGIFGDVLFFDFPGHRVVTVSLEEKFNKKK